MIHLYEDIFRVQLLGTSGLGISTFCEKFLSSIPESQEMFKMKDLFSITNSLFSRYSKLTIINEKKYELQIWIPRRRYYEDLLSSGLDGLRYLRNMNSVLLMYDITSLKTLHSLVEYIELIKKNNLNIPKIIVGNKGDIEDIRRVRLKYVTQFVKQYNISEYLEISVKSGEKVDFMFETLTKLMLKNFDRNIWKIVKKYIWYDERRFPHFDGDNVSEEDYAVIYDVHHPLRCIYCWMKEHCKYYPNLEDCVPHWWLNSKEYRNAQNNGFLDDS